MCRSIVLLVTVVLFSQSQPVYSDQESKNNRNTSVGSTFRNVFDCVSVSVNHQASSHCEESEDCIKEVIRFCGSPEGRKERRCNNVLAHLAKTECYLAMKAGKDMPHKDDDVDVMMKAGTKRARDDNDDDDNDGPPKKKRQLCEADELFGQVPGSSTQSCCFYAPHSKRSNIHRAPLSKYEGRIAKNTLEVHTIPIGQGDCTIIYCPNGKHAILFDCGSTRGNTFRSDDIRKYFVNIEAVTIVISHGHKDHYSIIPEVFSPENRDFIEKVIVGGQEKDYAAKSIKSWLQNLASKVQYMSNSFKEHTLDFCNDNNFEFVVVVGDNSSNNKNERGISMKLSCPSCLMSDSTEASVLFPGDMEGSTAENLVTKYPNFLKSSHYKMAHHGASRLANKERWLQTISPIEVHISHAYNNRYGHPRCEAIDLLMSLDSTVGTHKFNQTHNFTCTKNKNHIVQEIVHRIFNTAPRENVICFIVLSFTPGKPTTTTTFCGTDEVPSNVTDDNEDD